MTAYTVPTVGTKVRNIYTGREFVVTALQLVDFEQGAGPEMCVSVKGDRGEDDVWQGKVTAFEPVDDVIDAEVVEAQAEQSANDCRNTEHAHMGRHDRMRFCTPEMPAAVKSRPRDVEPLEGDRCTALGYHRASSRHTRGDCPAEA